MTTSQLARSIARHLDVPDPANLQADAAIDVVAAINSGLQLFYTEAPAIYKRTPFSCTLKAPVTMSLTFNEQYSNTLSGTPFDADWYGCGITGSGFMPHNEISGISEVLDDWLLPNLTVEAQILFNCQTLPVFIERVTSDVRCYHVGTGINYLLHRDQGEHCRLWRWQQYIPANRPHHYRIEPAGAVNGFDTVSLLRIHPAPIVDTIIRFEAEVSAASVRIADLINGAHLPVADAWHPLVQALCEGELSYSPLWKDPKTKDDIRKKAADTIASRIKKLPNDQGSPNNQVGTPRGF